MEKVARYGDEQVDHVTGRMAGQQSHRLPVMDRRQHLVGIVSVGDLAERQSPAMVGAGNVGYRASPASIPDVHPTAGDSLVLARAGRARASILPVPPDWRRVHCAPRPQGDTPSQWTTGRTASACRVAC